MSGSIKPLSDSPCRAVFCKIHPGDHVAYTTSIEDYGIKPGELIDNLKIWGLVSNQKRNEMARCTLNT
jgi:hypothetical protein